MDGYLFKNIDNDEYGVLASDVWQELFKMFELKQIMRQRESKHFAELLNRLREGNHSKEDILQLKQRVTKDYPKDVPHLFIQNAKVNHHNNIAHNGLPVAKYSIKARDSVIGTQTKELKYKVPKQVPNNPRKTK